jgi:hypothetical protein
MADTYPVRTEPLAVIKTPSLPTTGQVGMKEVLGIQEPYMKEKARLIPEISAAKGRVEEFKQAQQVTEAEGGVAATKGFAKAEKGAMQQYQTKLEKEPLPAFVPSKENSDDLATLFSLVSVIGMVVGGGGRENAQQAMSAMNGMLEGHQKGRADLYKQELSTFDKNFKSMVQKHAEFRKEMEDAVKLASTDKEAAMADAKLAATKAGSNIVKAMLDQGRLLDSYKFVDESQAGVDKAVAAEAKIRADAAKEKAAQQRHKEDLAARAQQHRENLAAKGGAGGGGQRATQQMFIVQRAVNALGGVASAVESLGQLPSGTTQGILPNLQTKDGMFNYMRNAAGRTMSSSESKAIETLFTGITRNLASIEASGAATGLVGLATQIEKLRPVAGDKAVDVALKMADIRRIATENIQPLIDSGLMPKQQADVASGLVKRIERAIPYTTQEVVNAAYGGKGKQTISESVKDVVERGQMTEAQTKRMRELEERERAAK